MFIVHWQWNWSTKQKWLLFGDFVEFVDGRANMTSWALTQVRLGWCISALDNEWIHHVLAHVLYVGVQRNVTRVKGGPLGRGCCLEKEKHVCYFISVGKIPKMAGGFGADCRFTHPPPSIWVYFDTRRNGPHLFAPRPGRAIARYRGKRSVLHKEGSKK